MVRALAAQFQHCHGRSQTSVTSAKASAMLLWPPWVPGGETFIHIKYKIEPGEKAG